MNQLNLIRLEALMRGIRDFEWVGRKSKSLCQLFPNPSSSAITSIVSILIPFYPSKQTNLICWAVSIRDSPHLHHSQKIVFDSPCQIHFEDPVFWTLLLGFSFLQTCEFQSTFRSNLSSLNYPNLTFAPPWGSILPCSLSPPFFALILSNPIPARLLSWLPTQLPYHSQDFHLP